MGITLKAFVREMSVVMPRFMREFVRKQAGTLGSGQVTLPQMGILMMLKFEGPSMMSQIAKALSVTTAAATGIVGRMVRAGFVKRVAGVKDRRVIKAALTKKGETVIDDIIARRREMMTEIFKKFSPDEREQYLRMVKKMYAFMAEDKD